MSRFLGSTKAVRAIPLSSVTAQAREDDPHVYVSQAGVELVATPAVLHPTAARGLAALLQAAADEHERQFTAKTSR